MRPSLGVLSGPTAITSADVQSAVLSLLQMYGYAIQAEWTGASLTGTVKLQASIDYQPANPAANGTWSDIPGSAQAISGPGSFLWNVEGAFYPYVRAYFVYGSNSGSITFLQCAKGP